MLGLFVYIETRAVDPIIPFELFRNRVVTVSVVAGFLAGIAMFGGISFVPLFAQGSLGMSATQAGSLLTPLMLSWVTMSIVGGRLLLKVGYRAVAIAGFIVMTIGFSLLSTFRSDSTQTLLYIYLVFIGAGLGLTMLTLLIAVQQAVDRSQLGTATSLNQFTRAIGGAFGVAVMGAVLTSGLTSNLSHAADAPGSVLTAEQAAAFASNPNALIDPVAKSQLTPEVLGVLQNAMTSAIHPVFIVGAVVAILALLTVLLLPRPSKEQPCPPGADCGETMLMAEQTTIDPRNEPSIEPN